MAGLEVNLCATQEVSRVMLFSCQNEFRALDVACLYMQVRHVSHKTPSRECMISRSTDGNLRALSLYS